MIAQALQRSFLDILVILALAAAAHAQANAPEVAPSVDLQRYQGKWYEIARLPNRFQRQCAGDVAAFYTLRQDGKITVVNECKLKDGSTDRAQGIARLADPKGPNSKLKVRFAPAFLSFLPFVWGHYWILDLAPDYTYALVGDPARKYLWILARTRQIPEATYQGLVEKARAQGFAVDRLIRTKHQD
jgi:apolipoprotein D and lipocalin family protein